MVNKKDAKIINKKGGNQKKMFKGQRPHKDQECYLQVEVCTTSMPSDLSSHSPHCCSCHSCHTGLLTVPQPGQALVVLFTSKVFLLSIHRPNCLTSFQQSLKFTSPRKQITHIKKIQSPIPTITIPTPCSVLSFFSRVLTIF